MFIKKILDQDMFIRLGLPIIRYYIPDYFS
jgi:hypothetical protein